MTAVDDSTETAPAAVAAPPGAEDKPAPRRWPLITGAALTVVITVTAVVHGLGSRGALMTGGIVAAVVLVLAVLWRLPHLRRHFARPRGLARPNHRSSFLSSRRGFSGGHRGKPFPGSRPQRSGGRGRLSGPALRSTALGRRLRPRLPAWVPGSAQRAERKKRRAAATRAGKRATAPASPGRVRRAWNRLTGKRASAGKAASSKQQPAKQRGYGKPKCQRCGKAATGEVTWADGTNQGTETLCNSCWDEGAKTAAAAAGIPPAPEPERQPGAALTPDTTTKPKVKEARTMSATEAAAEAIEQHIGGFEPQDGEEFDRFLAGLPRLYQSMGSALDRLAARFGEELPVDASVHDHIREMAATTAGLSEFADEAYRLHRAAHEREMERYEQPRPGEQMWDVNQ